VFRANQQVNTPTAPRNRRKFGLIVFISYDPGTITHPADVDVELRVMRPDGSDLKTVCALFGGQGTLNTNSWAADSRRFAYISYPAKTPAEVGSPSREPHA
jgi:hypothetical protein